MNKFCNECGGLVDQTTGECTNCHKKAFVPINRAYSNPKKPDLKKILLIVALALLLIVAGIFVFKLFGSGRKKNDIDYRERIDTGYNANGEEMYVATFKYDDDGNETYYEYSADSYYYAYKYKLDDNGNPVKMTVYNEKDSDPSEVFTYENEYDRKKNRISRKTYLNDEYRGCIEFEYDKDGNQIRSDFYDENDELISYYIYEYDKKGNQILREHYEAGSDALVSTYIWEYDDKDNPILEECYSDNTLEHSIEYEYEYDKKGKLISGYYYYHDENLDYSYEYEYDKKGRRIFAQYYNSEGEKGYCIETEYRD